MICSKNPVSAHWIACQGMPGPVASEAHNRIKEAGYRRKQEGAFWCLKKAYQPIDIPQKYAPRQTRLQPGSPPLAHCGTDRADRVHL
jgi:hypothetical protein